jgi:carbon monoxide dehydrogenase subunit G
MELSGQQIVAAPRQAVWNALNDPRILYECIPGCEDIEKVSDEETRVRVALKIGPVRARFTGKMLMSDIVQAERCKLSFEGAAGAVGFAKGSSRVELADEGGATKLTYSVEASVGGKLGQIGGRLIDSSAKKMADEFFASLNRQLTGGTVSTGDTAVESTSATKPAVVVALPDAAPETVAVRNTPEPRGAWSGGLVAELYRVGWFALGVAVTLLLKHTF